MLTRTIYMAISDKLTEIVNRDREPDRTVLNDAIEEHQQHLLDANYHLSKKFHLSKKSQDKLSHAHPYIIKVVKRAIKLSKVDFAVFEVMRTRETQRRYVKRGVSRTMDSYHFYGLAVDLVAYVNGKLTWDRQYYSEIRRAMHLAMRQISREEDIAPSVENGYVMWGFDDAHWQMKPCIFTNYQNPKHYFNKRKFKGFKNVQL